MPHPDVSPQHADYAADCRLIADQLGDRAAFVGFTFDGVRVEITIALVDAMLLVGDPSGVVEEGEAWALVSIVGKGAEFFPLTGWVDQRRVQELFGLDSQIAVGVTDLLVRVGIELKRKEIDDGWTTTNPSEPDPAVLRDVGQTAHGCPADHEGGVRGKSHDAPSDVGSGDERR